MGKIVLTFGLLAGAVMSAMMVVTFVFMNAIDFDNGEIIGYTTMVVAFLMVYFGVRSYRDKVAGGSITFGRAFVVGLYITLLASVCYVATWEVINYTKWPDFADRYAAHVIDKARSNGASPAELAKTQKQMDEFKQMYKNPLLNIAMTFVEPLPVGLLFALVTAGVLRRRSPALAQPA